ncbi:hypothetical protein BH23GEM10_BH23GEM10_04880 [soil metagenome]
MLQKGSHPCAFAAEREYPEVVRSLTNGGHTGFWGTAAHHCPEPDVTVVRHTNQADSDDGFIFRRLYDSIADALGMRQ